MATSFLLHKRYYTIEKWLFSQPTDWMRWAKKWNALSQDMDLFLAFWLVIFM